MSKIPEKILWMLQRISAVLLFIFFIWFLASIYSIELNQYNKTIKWIKEDSNALLLFFFSFTILFHANLGLSVIIDDYIHNIKSKKIFKMLKNLSIIFCIFFSGICLYLI